MQPKIKNSSNSDDEEDDLELLRQAALQSLKKSAPLTSNGFDSTSNIPFSNPKPFGTNVAKGVSKRGRGGRLTRNGVYNNRMRNSNLISVPTVESEQSHESLPNLDSNKKIEAVPKLILPQDRYCSTRLPVEEPKTSEKSSKFDRYNDSDDSDSDSESEDEKLSISESPKKLERSDSLEALMQELENQIQGQDNMAVEDSKLKMKPKKSKKPKESEIKIESDLTTNNDKDGIPKADTKEEVPDKPTGQLLSNKDIHKIPIKRKPKSTGKFHNLKKFCNNPPVNNLPRQKLAVHQPLPYVSSNVEVLPLLLPPFQTVPYSNYSVPLVPAVSYDVPVPYTFPNTVPCLDGNEICSIPNQMFPLNRYERPPSPLTIKPDILNTVSAPLSPRSAAFVLQNREIIERRKKSPRRSYSRSPSPTFRRSLSPPRYRRSRSPARRISPTYKRLSPNTYQRSSPNCLSPTRHKNPASKLSPGSQNSMKHSHKSSPNRTSVHNRLGIQTGDVSNEKEASRRSRSISLSLSPSPERYNADNTVDPILQARKRKFETSVNIPTEGIIRLKPKTEGKEDETEMDIKEPNKEEEEEEEELPETADDAYIDLNLKVDDLFSDEESDSENEGRFKSSNKEKSATDVTIVPFSQLLKNPSRDLKNEIPDRQKRSSNRDHNNRQRNRNELSRRSRDRSKIRRIRSKNSPSRDRIRRPRSQSRIRSRSSLNEDKSSSSNSSKSNRTTEKLVVKSNTSFKKSPVDNKRIEIKIRNAAKHEGENNKVKEEESFKEKSSTVRKVKVASFSSINQDVETLDAEIEPEIILDEEGEIKDVTNKNEGSGDLRAQLSRKRAERQNMLPKVEGVQSRILRNALQGAVFTKTKKSKTRSKEKETAPVDKTGRDFYGIIKQTREKFSSNKRKVQVLHCDVAQLTVSSEMDNKLPIHLRLGVPGIVVDSKILKKKKQSKNRGNLDQV